MARTVGVSGVQSEVALRLLLEQLPAVVWCVDSDLVITASSGAGLAAMGLRPGQLVGVPLIEYLGTDDPTSPSLVAHRQALNGTATDYDLEWTGRKWRCHTEPLRDPGGAIIGVVGMAVDVTASVQAQAALRAKEDELRQVQKMEAVARLAGGIAHDFNNLLTAVTGYAYVLQRALPKEDVRRSDVEHILTAAQKATALTQQLLVLSRRQAMAPQVLDLGGVVFGLETVLRRVLGPGIELTLKASPALGRISADRGQLEQSVINLVTFARDRLVKGGGRIAIEMANQEVTATGPAARLGIEPGAYILLRLSDTGPVIDLEQRQKIFEPFASNEATHVEQGLGLASVYSIVQQSLGHLSVDARLSSGAAFEVLLPQAKILKDAAPTVRVPSQGSSATGKPTAAAVILVVEDDMAVRRLACAALNAEGYQVLEAESCHAALELGETYQGRIDLMLTDVVMPEMTGPQVAARLAPFRPEMRILYMSGYGDQAVVHRGVLAAGQALVEKPFTPARLAQQVQRALRGQ